MSRFFDFLQKSNGLLGTSTAESEAGPETQEPGHDARRILSVLERAEPGAVPESDNRFPLNDVRVQCVEILPSTHLAFHTDPTSPAADRFRLLRMRLRTLRQAGKLKSLLITSPLPEDGKSTVALNLAVALAEGGKRRVLLIEADLHQASMNRQFGLDLRVGLTECLQTGANPWSAMCRLEPLNCYLLTAGGPSVNPTELLQPEVLTNILQKLYSYFDWIVIDSPPVIPLTDAVSLAQIADATLLVARAGRTPEDAIETAIGLLGRKRIAGIVLNGIEGLNRAYSNYAAYYPGNGQRTGDWGKRTEAEAGLARQSQP